MAVESKLCPTCTKTPHHNNFACSECGADFGYMVRYVGTKRPGVPWRYCPNCGKALGLWKIKEARAAIARATA